MTDVTHESCGSDLALRAESVSKEFPGKAGPLVVLWDISLTLTVGEAVAIMGPSGSGKSTLLNILGTLEPPTSGLVIIGGRDPFKMSEAELALFRNRHLGFVFQDHHLLPQCTALENVLIPTLVGQRDLNEPRAEYHPAVAGARAVMRKGGDAAMEKARGLLERVGLGQRLDHRPAELSGGERQRVALARALVNHPLLVLADEPTGNLDRTTADAVGSLLLELHHQERTTLVVITHSQSLASRFARRHELVDGRLMDET